MGNANDSTTNGLRKSSRFRPHRQEVSERVGEAYEGERRASSRQQSQHDPERSRVMHENDLRDRRQQRECERNRYANIWTRFAADNIVRKRAAQQVDSADVGQNKRLQSERSPVEDSSHANPNAERACENRTTGNIERPPTDLHSDYVLQILQLTRDNATLNSRVVRLERQMLALSGLAGLRERSVSEFELIRRSRLSTDSGLGEDHTIDLSAVTPRQQDREPQRRIVIEPDSPQTGPPVTSKRTPESPHKSRSQTEQLVNAGSTRTDNQTSEADQPVWPPQLSSVPAEPLDLKPLENAIQHCAAALLHDKSAVERFLCARMPQLHRHLHRHRSGRVPLSVARVQIPKHMLMTLKKFIEKVDFVANVALEIEALDPDEGVTASIAVQLASISALDRAGDAWHKFFLVNEKVTTADISEYILLWHRDPEIDVLLMEHCPNIFVAECSPHMRPTDHPRAAIIKAHNIMRALICIKQHNASAPASKRAVHCNFWQKVDDTAERPSSEQSPSRSEQLSNDNKQRGNHSRLRLLPAPSAS
ncbi:hypothetical protein PYCC9005_003339 [Savitreella phatthalungensis]